MDSFTTEPVLIGMRGYSFTVTEESIHRYGINGEEVSQGLLVKDHFTEVYRAIAVAKILMDGGCKEAMGIYLIDDQEKYEEAPTLEQCVTALEEQLALIGGEERYGNETAHLRNWLSDLRNGRWYKSSPEYDRPRIPKIETTGEKIYSGIMDLVWKLDNGEKSSFERMRDAVNNTSLSDLMPSINPGDEAPE